MLTTVSPRTTIAKHSAGWRVMQLVKDRQAKGILESPGEWSQHRYLSPADKIRLINFRFEQLAQLYAYRGIRP